MNQKQDIEMTTLSVPKQFRQKLIENYDGRNDLQRIQKWAEDYEQQVAYENVQKFMKTDDFREIIAGVIRKQLITYNSDTREELENIIEETVRGMRR